MLRVLIADDESKVCQLIEKLVDWDALGMEVVAVAENGIEALEKIKEFHPDIVITDIRMPGYDGLDLIRLGKEEAPKAEFVIISGYRHFEYAQMAIRYGVNAYLLKPIKKDELTETLKRLSTRFRAQTEQLSQEEKTRLAIRSDEKNLREVFQKRHPRILFKDRAKVRRGEIHNLTEFFQRQRLSKMFFHILFHHADRAVFVLSL
jgi:two-component system, response regulator YesN